MKKVELSLHSLRLLVAVAEAGGLVRAAQQLGISQSSASHALAALEQSLGVTLVVRESSGLQLTELAISILPHARQALESAANIRAEVAAFAGLHTGVLRIGSIPSVAASILPSLLRLFVKKFPGIQVTLLEGSDGEVAQWVRERVVHIGFTALPVPDLLAEEVTKDEWLALVPAAGNTELTSMSLRALAKQQFLMSQCGCEPLIQDLFDGAKLKLSRTRGVRELPTLKAMVAEGLGVSIVPSLAAVELRKGVRALPLCPRKFRRIGFVLPRNSARIPALEAWIAVVHQANGR